MRKCFLLAAVCAATLPQAAHATGGLSCRTADPEPVEITLGFGHSPSAGLFLHRLRDDGEEIAVELSQWWMNGTEVRLALLSSDAMREEAVMSADWNEATRSYDGSIWRSGKRRWIRCREG